MTLRAILKDGEPWFVAKDVCAALGMSLANGSAHQWTKYLDDDEVSLIKRGEFPGLPNRGLSVVSESGLYALIMRSRKPEAQKFRKWVTSVVLPAIRKDGAYIKGEERVATGAHTGRLEIPRKLLQKCERVSDKPERPESPPGPPRFT